jgi:hypothetical protein
MAPALQRHSDPGPFAPGPSEPSSASSGGGDPGFDRRRWVVRYRGFVLIPQADLGWLVRPERSPMVVLPFRAPASSLADVKALVDGRLAQRQAA